MQSTLYVQNFTDVTFYRLTEDHLQYLRGLIDDDCTLTIRHLQESLQATTGLNVCESTVHNVLQGFNYSFKRISLVTVAAQTEAIKAERRIFAHWLCQATLQNRSLIFFG